MVLALLRGLNQFVNDVWRGRLIRVPHAEVNDVLASTAGIKLESLDLRKDVGWEPIYAVEPLHTLLDGRTRQADRTPPSRRPEKVASF